MPSYIRFDGTLCPQFFWNLDFLCFLLHHHPIKPQESGGCHWAANHPLPLILSLLLGHVWVIIPKQSCSSRLLSHLCSRNSLHTNTPNKCFSHSWASWGSIPQPSLRQWKFTTLTVWFGATVFFCPAGFFMTTSRRCPKGLSINPSSRFLLLELSQKKTCVRLWHTEHRLLRSISLEELLADCVDWKTEHY